MSTTWWLRNVLRDTAPRPDGPLPRDLPDNEDLKVIRPRMESRLRVLFLNPGVDLGGAERSLLLLLPALRARGIDARIGVFREGPFHQRVAALGFPTTCLQVASSVRRGTRYHVPATTVVRMMAAGVPAAVQIARLVRRDRIDLVHTNGAKAHLLGGLAARMARVPVIWHVRDFPPPGLAGRIFSQAARRLPSLVIANSRAVADTLAGETDHRRILVVPNPVDLARLEPTRPRDRVRRELGLAGSGPVIGQIAHLTPWKGHELFLSIARQVCDRFPDAWFVVAGGSIYETEGHSGYEESLKRRAAALGLAERVAFLGIREDVAEILAALDVLVHCPIAPEPFGRVLAEAMGAGRAVVAARSGGIPEVVADGVTGTLVEPGDTGAFSRAIVELVENRDLRARFGWAGRVRAETLFQVDSHAARVLGAYGTALTSSRAAA